MTPRRIGFRHPAPECMFMGRRWQVQAIPAAFDAGGAPRRGLAARPRPSLPFAHDEEPMTHPMSIPLAKRGISWAQGRYAIGACTLIAALVLLAVFLYQTTTRAAALPLHRICRPWDEKAADALARLVHEPGDASLRQAGDALFRLRRARRNCRAGWLAVACQDYQAIVGLRRVERAETPKLKAPCALAMIE
jgi:hypothetical protein